MKKIKSLGISALVSMILVILVIRYSYTKITPPNNSVRDNVSTSKFSSHNVITRNLGKGTMTIMGSSELSRKYQFGSPSKVFDYSDLNVMLIGQAHYQCFEHTLNLGSIAKKLDKKKVVLILSPQWFHKGGISSEVFSTRYSNDQFYNYMNNNKISKELKNKVVKRALDLTKINEKINKDIKDYAKIENSGNDADKSANDFKRRLTGFKRTIEFFVTQGPTIDYKEIPSSEGVRFNWNELIKEGEKYTKKKSQNNPLKIDNAYYKRFIKRNWKKTKGAYKNLSYSRSKEYEDLKLFLNTAKELNIEVLVVNVPVNGKWADHTGFKRSEIAQYYKNVKNIVKEYENVSYDDLSSHIDDPYFLEDIIHVGSKGWGYINKDIYNFYNN